MKAKKKANKKPKHVSLIKVTTGRKRKAPGSKLTIKQKQFIEAFEQLGVISGPNGAAEAVNVSHMAHYDAWWKIDAYREAFGAAQERFDRRDTDRVISEVQKRAYDGWEEEVIEEEREAVVTVKDGKSTMEMVPKRVKRRRVKRWSTSCLLWLANLRKGNPARLEVTGPGGGPLEMDNKITLAQFRSLVKSADDVE